MKLHKHKPAAAPWRNKLYTIIFESDTPRGKLFDILLLIAIALSVVVVSLSSIATIKTKWYTELFSLEWGFTLVFTVEYILRIISVQKPSKYIFSFYGMVDFLGIIPTYLSLLIPGTHILLVIRVLRVLRVFQVMHLSQFIGAAETLSSAMRASRVKIFVFIYTVLTLVILLGSLMYLIEGEENGFTSIPRSIYWAIVTLTTVGYGDISPQTNLGQLLAAFIMILGYGIIAVPTGIVSAEMTKLKAGGKSLLKCPRCDLSPLDRDALYCKRCGEKLDSGSEP
jgi:voltage-gated potassium channel